MDEANKIWGINLADNSKILEVLVYSVYREIVHIPTDLHALKKALINLMSYLSSKEGLTDYNCKTVDMFFCVRDDWETDWKHLPSQYKTIFDDIGGALHDTVSSPYVAVSLESTPAQLLKRIQKLDG